MSNYSGINNLFVVKIQKKNPKEGLETLVCIDADYEHIAKEVVEKVMNENKTLELQIKAIIEYCDEENSRFFLGNDTFCSGYKSELTEINDSEVLLSIAYGT